MIIQNNKAPKGFRSGTNPNVIVSEATPFLIMERDGFLYLRLYGRDVTGKQALDYHSLEIVLARFNDAVAVWESLGRPHMPREKYKRTELANFIKNRIISEVAA